MRGRSIQPDARHEAFLAELKAALGNSGKDIDAAELLAISSQFVGMLLAMQDQRTMTIDRAMATIERNIEIGNHTAIEANLGRPEGAA
jgi:hypothetical protein